MYLFDKTLLDHVVVTPSISPALAPAGVRSFRVDIGKEIGLNPKPQRNRKQILSVDPVTIVIIGDYIEPANNWMKNPCGTWFFPEISKPGRFFQCPRPIPDRHWQSMRWIGE